MRIVPGIVAAVLIMTMSPAEAPAQKGERPPIKREPSAFKIKDGQLELPGGASDAVRFETGSDRLKPESDAALEYVVDFLTAKSAVTLMRIEVHSDNSGDASANQALSEKRAYAVSRWLVARGIACSRLIPVGFGGSKPVAGNDTPAGRAANRRTAFVLAALNNRMINGAPADGGGRVAGDPCKS